MSLPQIYTLCFEGPRTVLPPIRRSVKQFLVLRYSDLSYVYISCVLRTVFRQTQFIRLDVTTSTALGDYRLCSVPEEWRL